MHHKDNIVQEYNLCIASVSIGTTFLHQGTATGVSHDFIPLIRSFCHDLVLLLCKPVPFLHCYFILQLFILQETLLERPL